MLELPKITEARKKIAEIQAQKKINENKERHEHLVSLQNILAHSVELSISRGDDCASEYVYTFLIPVEFQWFAKPFKELGYKITQGPDNCGRIQIKVYWGIQKFRWFKWF